MRDEGRPGYDPEGLSALAAEVAARIATSLSHTETGAELLSVSRKCPENKLCCRTGYRCSDFWCEGGFRCMNDFSHFQVDR